MMDEFNENDMNPIGLSDIDTGDLLSERPEVLPGCTYHIQVPNLEQNMVDMNITINDHFNMPFEIFIDAKDKGLYEQMNVISILLSRLLRESHNAMEIAQELKSVHSPTGFHWIPKGGGESPSVSARIGAVLEQHIKTTQERINNYHYKK